MVALARPIVLAWLVAASCAAPQDPAHERYQAVETGALLSPRSYPPLPPGQPLQKRQSACQANHHPCNGIGANGNGVCCGNDEYCVINPNNSSETSCCPIGSTCGSRCSESQVECNATTTITSSGTTITSTSPACCGRQCPSTSMFGCPSSLGNGCCSYGSTCAPGRQCVSTVTTSSSESAVVTQIPEGCTTSQIKCAPSLGGGCCAVTQTCVKLSDGARCAEATITPTASGLTAVTTADSELSAGAKAGISVGVIVIAGLVIGGVTYFCLRKRRRISEAGSTGHRARPTMGTVIGSGGGGGGRDMSDMNSEALSRPGGLPGVAQDYFGPAPQIGPYSDAHDELSPGTTPGADRGGVPVVPHGPSDIAVPVEIDSGELGRSPQPGSGVPSSPAGEEGAARYQPPPSHRAVEGTFELYGSSPSPSGDGDVFFTPYEPSPGTQVSPYGEGPSPSPGDGQRTG